MAFLEEFSRIKGTILQQFLSSQDFVDLVTNSKDYTAPYLNLRYTQVFPYPWLDDTISEEKTFVCFDLDSPRVNSQTIKTINLTIWQFSHENLIKMANGTRTDILSSCIDKILNGFVGAGASQIELTGTRRINPAKRFYGRQLEYTINDINRWCSG
jgi:hypothetical protein